MHTPFINIYYQLGNNNYFVFFNWLRKKLEFNGQHISPKKGCCKTWIEKWNWKCTRDGENDLLISQKTIIPKGFIEDPLGLGIEDIDSEE